MYWLSLQTSVERLAKLCRKLGSSISQRRIIRSSFAYLQGCSGSMFTENGNFSFKLHFCCRDKNILTKNNLGEKRLILAHKSVLLGSQSKLTSTVKSTERINVCTCSAQLCCSPLNSQCSKLRSGTFSHILVGFPTSVNAVKTILSLANLS